MVLLVRLLVALGAKCLRTFLVRRLAKPFQEASVEISESSLDKISLLLQSYKHDE